MVRDWRGEKPRFLHLCPLGRKDPETRHEHGSNSETSFYHDDPEDPRWGFMTVMFGAHKLDDGRTIVYPIALNVTAMGTFVAWADPVDERQLEHYSMLGKRVTATLKQCRMLLKPVSE